MNNLIFNNLNIGYNKVTLIENINLKLSDGDTIGIIGKNGSGKSTFLKSLFNPNLIKNGTIFLNKADLKDLKNEEFKNVFSYVPQELFFPDYLTTKELLKLNTSNVNINEKEYLSKFNAEKFLNLEISKLSGGEKRKIALCSALYKNPKVLLLDEPETHLDPVETEFFIDSLRKVICNKNLIVLIASHRLNILEKLCSKYLIIQKSNFIEYSDVNEFSLRDCYA